MVSWGFLIAWADINPGSQDLVFTMSVMTSLFRWGYLPLRPVRGLSKLLVGRWYTIPSTLVRSVARIICPDLAFTSSFFTQDMEYDAKLGVGSTAVSFGRYIKLITRLFGLVFVCLLAYSGYLKKQGLGFWVISLGGSATHMLWQVGTFEPKDARNCQTRFMVRCAFTSYQGLKQP